MLVRDVLAAKGSKVWTIRTGQTLQDALQQLVTHQIGALLVLNDKDNVAGILSERDILRQCHRHPVKWVDLRVHAVMTRVLHTTSLDADLQEVMGLMTEKRVRHIPVMKDGTLSGIVSIGDVVKERLKDTVAENEYMRQYMAGS